MRNILILSFFLIGFTGVAQAGSAPIFITPNVAKPSTPIARNPTIVSKTQAPESRTYTNAGRVSYEIVDSKNPFAGTSFGRIKSEQNIYDKETGKYFNQYDYMGLMAQRGNITELNKTAQYYQQNGVFDPMKFQTAIQAGRAGQIGLPTSPTIDGVAAPVAPIVEQPKPVLVYKNQAADTTPQKIHNGYDDEPIAEEPKQRRSGPIFLR